VIVLPVFEKGALGKKI